MEFISNNLFWIFFFGSILVIYLIRKVGGKPYFLQSRYEQSIEIPRSENVENSLTEVMNKVGFKDVNYNASENRFYATALFSMSSWYENIEIKLIPSDTNYQLQFRSSCGYPYQVYDWGKNKENFDRFHKELMKKL